MPTDATRAILEENADFKKFAITVLETAMVCGNAGYNHANESSIQYNQEQLEKAQKRLKQVEKMSSKAAFRAAAKGYSKERSTYEGKLAQAEENGRKLSKILQQATAYTPANSQQEGFKKVMLEHLERTISMDASTDYYANKLKNLRLLTPEQWKKQEIENIGQEIASSTQSIARSKEALAGAKAYCADIVASLG